jgi:hypothetical protein
MDVNTNSDRSARADGASQPSSRSREEIDALVAELSQLTARGQAEGDWNDIDHETDPA